MVLSIKTSAADLLLCQCYRSPDCYRQDNLELNQPLLSLARVNAAASLPTFEQFYIGPSITGLIARPCH